MIQSETQQVSEDGYLKSSVRIDDQALPPHSSEGDFDPLAGIPVEVIRNVGAYDTDHAGGCG